MLPVHDDKENSLIRSVSTLNKNNHFLTELQDVPNEYIEYVNALYRSKAKFDDTIFGRGGGSVIAEGDGYEWERLSDMTPGAATVYQRVFEGKKSKVLKLLELLEENLCLSGDCPANIHRQGGVRDCGAVGERSARRCGTRRLHTHSQPPPLLQGKGLALPGREGIRQSARQLRLPRIIHPP